MALLSTIVEGDGEVHALPVLLRRLQVWLTPQAEATILQPIRVRRDRFLNRSSEFERMIGLAAAKSGEGGKIFIVLDADDDCPASLGAQILERARKQAPHRALSVVLANREYEAWFIAAASSLSGQRGFLLKPGDDRFDAEGLRDAKGWMRARMSSGTYGEVADQAAFSARFDLQQAHDHSRSFRKLCSEWRRNFE